MRAIEFTTMDINTELERIQKHGFMVIINMGASVSFVKNRNTDCITKKKDEKWDHCMYRSILEFDDKYPDLR